MVYRTPDKIFEEEKMIRSLNKKGIIYLSCSSQYLDIAKEAMSEIRELGHAIAIDWTRSVEKQRKGLLRSKDLNKCANDDLTSLYYSDALIYVHTETVSFGCGVEIGAAIARNIPIIIVEEHEDCVHIFSRLCEKVPSIESAILVLESQGFIPDNQLEC